MLCQECRNQPATVKITTISAGHKEEVHLCEACARKRGEVEFGGEGQVSLGDMLAAFLQHQAAAQPAVKGEPAPAPCPGCGMPYEQLARTGKLGCRECFSHFEPQVRRILRHVHGSTRHAGRAPLRRGGKLRMQQDIERLTKELTGCVQAEDFERAAQLRDEIRQLERAVAGGSADTVSAPVADPVAKGDPPQ